MVIETRLECLLSIEKAIKFAKSIDGIFIPKQDEEMIFHCRKSFLFCDSQPGTEQKILMFQWAPMTELRSVNS